jgi:putative ABC transport system permease protein
VNRAILRKSLADLRSHRLQSALILVILIAASTALALALIVQQNADKPWRRGFEQSNGAHVTFSGENAAVDLTPLAAHDDVVATDGPRPVAWNRPLIEDGQKYEVNVIGMEAEPPAVARPLVQEGRWLAAGATAAIVLERSFADYIDAQPGDSVQFKVGDQFVSFTVTGTALDTARGTYPDWQPARAWVLADTLPLLEPDPAQLGSVLSVRLRDPAASQEFTERALAGLERRSAGGLNDITDWHEPGEDFSEWNRVNAVFLGVFTVFALLAVGMIIANSIGGRVLAQFREIGLLKAAGFTPRQVAGIYLIQHLALALVGSLLGLGLALVIAPIYLDRLAETYNTTTGSAFDPLLALLTVGAILLAVTLFTLLPAWRGGRVPAVQAITTGFTAARARPSLPARLALRLRLPLSVSVGVKDAFARPWRAVLTIAALSFTIVTITFTLGLEATIQKIDDKRGLVEEPWDVEVIREQAADADIRRVLDTNAGVESYVSSYALAGETTPALPGANQAPRARFDLRALGDDVQQSGYVMVDGRMFAAPGEAIVGRSMFDQLGLRLGDQLTVQASREPFDRPEREPVTLTVVGTYVEPDGDGMVVLFPAETAQQLFPGIQPDTYEIMMQPGADWDALTAEVQAATGYGVRIDLRERGTPPEAATLRGIMIGLCAVLLVIGLANMLTTTLLGVRERARDIGIFKTLGLTPRQVVAGVAASVSLLTLLATVVGIPLGVLLYRGLFTVVGEGMMDADPELYTPPSWTWLALVIPGALIFAALASILPARRATGVQIAEVLRYE